jgi:two-component system, NarL family, sensor kinase
VVTTVVAVVQRWRAAVDVERQQLKWVVLGYVATLLVLVGAQLLPPEAAGVGAALGMVPLPLAIGVAVLRYGLWEVDLVISRTLVYGLLSGLVAAVYAGTVWLLGEVVEEGTGAPIVATTAVALLTLPMRTWLQRHVNRWVHGDTQEPYAVLARLGERLGSAAAPDELVDRVLPEVVEQVARSLRAQEAVLTLRDGTVASYGGGGTGEPLAVDLVYAGERLGTLSARRPAGFDEADVRALERLAAQAAVAAHTVLLSREAQRAREAVVLAREEERRRLRRDLHDGLGPTLAAVASRIDVARMTAARAPEEADRALAAARQEVSGMLAEVRRLVHGLRPQADQLSSPALHLEVEVDGDVEALPAAVEVACFRIVSEALTNVARHAGATRCTVRLRRTAGRLEVEVADDGAGIEERTRAGVGLLSLRERAEELGGRCEVRSVEPHGTLVTAVLPVPASTLAASAAGAAPEVG